MKAKITKKELKECLRNAIIRIINEQATMKNK